MKSRKWARRRRNRMNYRIWATAPRSIPLADIMRVEAARVAIQAIWSGLAPLHEDVRRAVLGAEMERGIGLIEFGPGGTDGPPGWLFQAPSLLLPPELLEPRDQGEQTQHMSEAQREIFEARLAELRRPLRGGVE